MKLATRIRSGLAPYLAEPWIAFPAALVLLIVLTWWSPWGVMDRVEAVVLVALYLFIGAELLRRKVIGEHPEEARPESRSKLRGERIERIRQGAAGAWRSAAGAVSGIGSSRRAGRGVADRRFGATRASAEARRAEGVGSAHRRGVCRGEESRPLGRPPVTIQAADPTRCMLGR